MVRDWKSSYARLHGVNEAAFPPACLHYLLQLVRSAHAENPGRNFSPQDWSLQFRQRSRRDFGPLLPLVLKQWRLGGPADLARAMLLLGRHGCLNLDPADTVESFAAGDSRPFLDA